MKNNSQRFAFNNFKIECSLLEESRINTLFKKKKNEKRGF
jgi:hypothetical protein